MPVFRLDEDLWFPSPYLGEEDGALAVGGDLSPERLILAYSNGIFPWFGFKESHEPFWYCPLDRFVIFPDEIHVSHSMRTLINGRRYHVTFNKAFDEVINNCARAQGRHLEEGAWLGPQIIRAYTALHRLGIAESVEVWEDSSDPGESPRLVGGLYGVALRNAFFGESMFSLSPSASKLALIALADKARQLGWHFIDCQFETPHLKSMGARHLPYEDYMFLLNSATD